MLKDDSGLKIVPMLGDLLDLPVIEASLSIQNASLISFLGASGAEIDGAKVAEPNVPRPVFTKMPTVENVLSSLNRVSLWLLTPSRLYQSVVVLI